MIELLRTKVNYPNNGGEVSPRDDYEIGRKKRFRF